MLCFWTEKAIRSRRQGFSRQSAFQAWKYYLSSKLWEMTFSMIVQWAQSKLVLVFRTWMLKMLTLYTFKQNKVQGAYTKGTYNSLSELLHDTYSRRKWFSCYIQYVTSIQERRSLNGSRIMCMKVCT